MRPKTPENANPKPHSAVTRRFEATGVRVSQPCSDLPYVSFFRDGHLKDVLTRLPTHKAREKFRYTAGHELNQAN